MAGQLTTEQLMLLNNLMYMNNNDPLTSLNGCEGKTVGEIINSIDVNQLDGDKEYTTFTNGAEWKQMIEAVQADPTLMNVKIVSTYTDEKGADSILFENPASNEAVVVYEGTASAEWKDNFLGGAGTDQPDGVSTAQQQSALDWYQSLDMDQYDSVTVSGHSKGGNKAKYITVMDDSVDRCVSFDGQGFSDEFMEKYQDQIADNQYKVENHNIEGDYVNFLLNDIGESTYYETCDGEVEFLENHAMSTFLHYNEDGTAKMIPGEQSKDIQNLDQFLNSYLRSLSDADKKETMELVGELAEMVLSGEKMSQEEQINYLLDLFTQGDNVENAGNLLAYLIRYEQENPQFAKSIKNILKELGMGDSMEMINTILDVVNSDKFNDVFSKLLGDIDWVVDRVPDWLLKKILDWLKEEYNINLTPEQLRKLLSIAEVVSEELPEIEIVDNGKDVHIKDTIDIVHGDFMVNTQQLERIVQELAMYSNEISAVSSQVGEVIRNLDGSLLVVKFSLKMQQKNVNRRRDACDKLKNALEDIARQYNRTEQKIVEQTK